MQAFLKVHIKEEDRDAICFNWLRDKDQNQIEKYRFTRALIELVPLFILGASLTAHLGGCKEKYPTKVDEIQRTCTEKMSFQVGITYQKLSN